MKKIFSLVLLCAAFVLASCKPDEKPSVGVESLTLNKAVMSIIVGASETLTATIAPKEAPNKLVTWTSSDATVATVQNGLVTGVKVGTAVITATSDADPSKKETCIVTVNKIPTPVTGITINKTKLLLPQNSKDSLMATVLPSDATNKDVTWKSSNSTIVTVLSRGRLISFGDEGTVTITVTSDADTTIKATCEVTVVRSLAWATGNLVADGANGAKIGAATDNGLYFQFGSLIGWSETGDPAIAVKPVGYTGPATWNENWTGDTSTENVAIGTGDPCKYYLNGAWRLPTNEEFRKLIQNSGYPNVGPWKWDAANKCATNSKLGLILPASGARDYLDGRRVDVGTDGYYWSAEILDSWGCSVSLGSSELAPSVTIRSRGGSVRCVKDLVYN